MNLKLKAAGLIAGVVATVALTSAISLSDVPLEVGNKAPEFTLSQGNDQKLALADLKGKNTTIHFWSVMDAESRIENIRLASSAEKNGENYIGICVDKDVDLAKEVMEADNLPKQARYFANEQVKDEYLENAQTRTVKIDSYGTVAALK